MPSRCTASSTTPLFPLLISFTILLIMDPTSGLSVATATVQFVDFGCKVLSTAYKIKASSGVVPGYHDMATTTNNIMTLCKTLRESLDERQTKQAVVSKADVQIANIAGECCVIADELLLVLEKKAMLNPGKWDSFRMALACHWSQNKVELLEKRLHNYRRDLDSFLLASLR